MKLEKKVKVLIQWAGQLGPTDLFSSISCTTGTIFFCGIVNYLHLILQQKSAQKNAELSLNIFFLNQNLWEASLKTKDIQ